MAEGWTYVLCHQDFRFELKDGEQTVGRSRTSDVAVNDPSVSRKHVILKPKEGIVVLTDLGSSNGTFVNGKKVQGEAILEDGDVLRLGDAELRVEVVHADSMQTVRMPIGGIPRPQPGEATFFLAAASMKLAEEAELAEAAAHPDQGPVNYGSHLAGPLATQRFEVNPPPAAAPVPAPAPNPSLQTQRLPMSAMPYPAAPPPAAPPPAATGGAMETQRFTVSPPAPMPPAPAAGAQTVGAQTVGAQTMRLTAAELRQLESSPPPAEPAPAFEESPISFDGAADPGYPSFEAPPSFEAWAPDAPETSFADVIEPSSPAVERPLWGAPEASPAAPPARPASSYVPPAPAFAPEASHVEPQAPSLTAPTPSFVPAAPAPPAFAPPPAPAAPPAFSPPAPAF